MHIDILRSRILWKGTNSKWNFFPHIFASVVQRTFKVYHKIQQWLRDELKPIHWGLVGNYGVLYLVRTILPATPEEIRKLISYYCKDDCLSTQVSWKKMGITCFELFKTCEIVAATTYYLKRLQCKLKSNLTTSWRWKRRIWPWF